MFDLDITLEKPTVETVLKSVMKSGLGLDISKKSTGITIYEDGKVETYQCVIEFDNDSVLKYELMRQAMETDFCSLFEGKHFEVIAIEDTIESINYETLRVLILLNSVIDKMIYEGKVTCDYFRRIGNSVWKKYFRTLRPLTKKHENDKVEIENICVELGFQLAVDYKDEKKSLKEKLGIQDQLDSLGCLIGVGLERTAKGGTVSKTKQRLVRKVELFYSKKDVAKKYSLDDLTVINPKGNLLAYTKSYLKDLDGNSQFNKFYFETDSLGTLGVEHGISDNPNGMNYVVVYQTRK